MGGGVSLNNERGAPGELTASDESILFSLVVCVGWRLKAALQVGWTDGWMQETASFRKTQGFSQQSSLIHH